MINFVKDKIASYLVKKQLSHRKHNSLEFSNFFSASTGFFVIMPDDEKDFHHSFEVLSFLEANRKNILIFTYEHRVSLLPLKFRKDAFTHGINDITRLKLPSKKLQETLGKMKYDGVLDLNIKENLYYSLAANLVDVRVRAGFTKPGSDRFYNLQVVNNEENPEKSYKNFLNCLSMF